MVHLVVRTPSSGMPLKLTEGATNGDVVAPGDSLSRMADVSESVSVMLTFPPFVSGLPGAIGGRSPAVRLFSEKTRENVDRRFDSERLGTALLPNEEATRDARIAGGSDDRMSMGGTTGMLKAGRDAGVTWSGVLISSSSCFSNRPGLLLIDTARLSGRYLAKVAILPARVAAARALIGDGGDAAYSCACVYVRSHSFCNTMNKRVHLHSFEVQEASRVDDVLQTKQSAEQLPFPPCVKAAVAPRRSRAEQHGENAHDNQLHAFHS
eukprot:Rhum_TRINITY_DN5269_c0_g1::Rhum_TRINITY_DN5269_c0_g1_i1::g.16989::m.16989